MVLSRREASDQAVTFIRRTAIRSLMITSLRTIHSMISAISQEPKLKAVSSVMHSEVWINQLFPRCQRSKWLYQLLWRNSTTDVSKPYSIWSRQLVLMERLFSRQSQTRRLRLSQVWISMITYSTRVKAINNQADSHQAFSSTYSLSIQIQGLSMLRLTWDINVYEMTWSTDIK